MPLNLTVKDIINAKPALEKLAQQDVDIVQSFKLAKCIRCLNDHYKDYDQSRIDLVKKLGEQDESGNFEVKDDAKQKEFISEMERLLNLKIEVNFDKFKMSDFEGVKMNPADALSLEKIFDI